MDSLSYSEVWSILSQLNIKDKIPQNILEKINNNRIKNYDANIDLNFPLEPQILGSKTVLLLCYLNLNYLCTNDEKELLYKIYEKNQTIKLKNKNQKNCKKVHQNSLLPVLVKKKSWYEKLWQNLSSYFKTMKGLSAYEK